ncbi:MAG: hypothetical protein IKQ99_00345 [Alphaproteobacteria bacterium]|nr:hypothetical protein [Alphaproteobacteria bacterium]
MQEKIKNILSYIFCVVLGVFFIYYWGTENILVYVILATSLLWLLKNNWKSQLICFSFTLIYFSAFSYFFVSEHYFFGYGEPKFFLEKFVPFPAEFLSFLLAIVGYLFFITILNVVCHQCDDK